MLGTFAAGLEFFPGGLGIIPEAGPFKQHTYNYQKANTQTTLEHQDGNACNLRVPLVYHWCNYH